MVESANSDYANAAHSRSPSPINYSPTPTSPAELARPNLQNKLKVLDLKSPSVRDILMKSLHNISALQNMEQNQSHIQKIGRTFPRTFRVQYSILSQDGPQAVIIEPRAVIENSHTPNFQRPPSRNGGATENQCENLGLHQSLVEALDKIFSETNNGGEESPEYTMTHAVDDSCILFEIKDDASLVRSGSFRQHTPQPSTVQLFDPQAFETTVNDPRSFEKLILKLSTLENQSRERKESPMRAESNLVEQISADQSVILISSRSITSMVPNAQSPLVVTPQPSLTQLSVFDLTDQSHIQQLCYRLELMAQDASKQEPKAVQEQIVRTSEHKATTGQTSLFISSQSPQVSPLVKTPNISEALSSNKMDPDVLAIKLAKLESSHSDITQSEGHVFEHLDDLEDGFEFQTGSQPVSFNHGSPLINTRAPNLRSPTTQLGLLQRLAQIKHEQEIK